MARSALYFKERACCLKRVKFLISASQLWEQFIHTHSIVLASPLQYGAKKIFKFSIKCLYTL